MTKLKALSVLNDCKIAKNELGAALKSGDQSLIRIRWITCLSFLRMVGHVLNKIDQPNFPDHLDDFKAIYNERKSDNIFKSFIEQERNQALKQYQVNIEEGLFKTIEIDSLVDENDDYLVDENGDYLVNEEHVTHHASKNRKPLDKWIEEGIEWWTDYIDELTAKLP